jgi:predicted DNA-binding transcriptional regulator YafY
MDRTERFYKIDALLQSNRFVPIDRMLSELEVSRATFKRDLEYMRERLNAPIEWDAEEGGYKYAGRADQKQSLPGLWFNSSEAYALLMMQCLLAEMQPGLLQGHVEPLRARLRALIETGNHAADDVESRVRLLTVGARRVPDKEFEVLAAALLNRKRLHIRYYGRGRDEYSERDVSPQLLIHYRGNWYLAAWCHLRQGLRSFAMDAIEQPTVLDDQAKVVSKSEMEHFVGRGYGIFSGANVRWAKLRFSAERARWVARENWHPSQRSTVNIDGTLLLDVPFTDPRELTMDILRHGKHVQVLEPTELRQAVLEELQIALSAYEG